jgi:hypothetical protein
VPVPCGFIPVPLCASVEMIYSVNGEIAENQFHVTQATNFTLSDLAALRTVVNNWDSAHWAALRSASVPLNRIRTRALHVDGGPFEDYSLPTPRYGSQGSGVAAGNVTWCIKKATTSAGRSYRGRWYIAGIPGTYFGADSNHIGATAGANVVAGLNTLIPALTAGGYTLVVVSYRHNKTCRSTGVVTTVSDFVAVDLNVDSMRRRLTGRGHT